MNEQVTISREALARFCRQHHVRRLSVFGSAVRKDFTPQSDVDVLIEFEPQHTPGFFGLYDLEQELASIFHGRKIDLRTPEDLSRHIRDEVLAQAEVQYVRR